MVYKKIQNENGMYVDENHVRYDVLEAHEAWTPQGLNAGWDHYDHKDTALQHYGLVAEEAV